MVEDNIKLAYHTANKWKGVPIEYDELISLCEFGLVKACITFDEKYNVKFCTYAVIVMENEIRQYIRKNARHTFAISLEQSVKDTDDLEIKETIADNKDVFSNIEMIQCIQKLFEKLTDLERMVVEMRIERPNQTQEQYADLIGITQAYYSRVLKSARNKMKCML